MHNDTRDSDADSNESRGSRRKRQTREKLLQAAMELMAERGMDGVAINEITERADVGFGTFYNHFPSKEAIYAALISQVFEDFADDIDARTRGMTDPAEILAFSIQMTLQKAAHDVLWGKFLVRESITPDALTRGLGQRLVRDVMTGLQQGRFASNDPISSFITLSGTMIAGIMAQQMALDSHSPVHQLSSLIGGNLENLPLRISRNALISLGLAADQADAISASVAQAL
jgi:AcrR family transcriptional regulator